MHLAKNACIFRALDVRTVGMTLALIGGLIAYLGYKGKVGAAVQAIRTAAPAAPKGTIDRSSAATSNEIQHHNWKEALINQ